MNLTEALDLALPELPARKSRGFPKLNPKFICRQEVVDGEPLIVGIISGKGWIYRFSPQYWDLIQYFDGERSYQEIFQIVPPGMVQVRFIDAHRIQ